MYGLVLPVTKVPGMTSHDVVDALRDITGERKVGHTGTLDPAAAGVLVCGVARATKLTPYLTGLTKVYHAVCLFGLTTDTLDGEGSVTGRSTREALHHLTRDRVEAALLGFEGTVRQVPPVYSAVRQAGERLHRRARRGEDVEPEPRTVTIHRLRLRYWRPADAGDGRLPAALLELRCSSGTYVRALARDLGQALGTGAYLHFLVRRRVGHFAGRESLTVAEWRRAAAAGELQRRAWSMSRATRHLPALIFDRQAADGLRHGRQPGWEDVRQVRGNLEDGVTARCLGPEESDGSERLLALAAVTADGDGWSLRLKRVLAAP